MASEIAIIKIPSPVVTLQQFAELEGVSERTAYRWTTGDTPRVPIEKRVIRKGCKKAGGLSEFITLAGRKNSCVRLWGTLVFSSLLRIRIHFK